ncbi:ion transport peptide-like [Caerostris extrusa]|uniref:Ion transport peptide-like n=1 Tax=Caerostris extrusa TaxID=172846 RepID=A0AAV4R050_CAEEX|nr:ion transport peptide-like [Caerostris extrusa]
MKASMPSAATFVILILGVVVITVICVKEAERGFVSLGCMGTYDKADFFRLDRLCDECYQMFREPEVSNCFKNNYFPLCVDALLLLEEQRRLDAMVNRLYGKR